MLFLIIYIAIFVLLIIDFARCIKGKARWAMLFTLEILSVILSGVLLFYYDSLPGYGFMSGLSYLGEILLSYGALILYSVLFVITLITELILHCVRKNK